MKQILLGILLAARFAPAAPISTDITLRDEPRGRDLECRVHYPEAGTKLPLIVFSHGFGADRTAFELIARHWAEHGYVVVLPSHIDGAGKSAGQSLPSVGKDTAGKPAVGNRFQRLLGDPAKVEHRVRDVVFIMDASEQLGAKIPALVGLVDSARIGVGGHSLGAYTASLLGGVTVDLGGQKARSFADPRVRCILPISVQGTGQQGLTPTSWSGLALPMMTITGSADKGAGGQGPDWKRQPYEHSPTGDKYLVFIEGANHVSFGGCNGRDNAFTPAVKAATLVFWNAYLQGDATAKASLQNGSVLDAWKATARVTSK